MDLYYPLHYGQTYAGPFALSVHLVEEAEDLLLLLEVDSYPIVPDEEYCLLTVLSGANMDLWARLISQVLHAVLYQVDQHLHNSWDCPH